MARDHHSNHRSTIIIAYRISDSDPLKARGSNVGPLAFFNWNSHQLVQVFIPDSLFLKLKFSYEDILVCFLTSHHFFLYTAG